MPTLASIHREKVMADILDREEKGEDVVVHAGGLPHGMPGKNIVFANDATRFVCIRCNVLFGEAEDSTFTWGTMAQHCKRVCLAKKYVVLDYNAPHVLNAGGGGDDDANANANEAANAHEDNAAPGGNITQEEEEEGEQMAGLDKNDIKEAWNRYCSDHLFLPGGGLFSKVSLVAYIKAAEGNFYFNTNKPNKEDYKLLVRNTPPHFDKEHPFWSTL